MGKACKPNDTGLQRSVPYDDHQPFRHIWSSFTNYWHRCEFSNGNECRQCSDPDKYKAIYQARWASAKRSQHPSTRAKHRNWSYTLWIPLQTSYEAERVRHGPTSRARCVSYTSIPSQVTSTVQLKLSIDIVPNLRFGETVRMRQRGCHIKAYRPWEPASCPAEQERLRRYHVGNSTSLSTAPQSSFDRNGQRHWISSSPCRLQARARPPWLPTVSINRPVLDGKLDRSSFVWVASLSRDGESPQSVWYAWMISRYRATMQDWKLLEIRRSLGRDCGNYPNVSNYA